jgi:C4-type Zn-finger protein
MQKETQARRCPYCMRNELKPIRQTWSFKHDDRKTIVEIEMLCDACGRSSTWLWVEKD